MTIEEFSKTRWGAGMKAKILSTEKVKDIVSVDFEKNAIGFSHYLWDGSSVDDLDWEHCEGAELVA